MSECCLVCNSQVGLTPRLSTNIYKEYVNISLGKSFANLLGEVLEKTISVDSVPYSNIICKKCHKTIIEYDSLQMRLQLLKSDLRSQFKSTLPKHDLKYDAIASMSPASSPVNSDKRAAAGPRVVLPASKLQPLPPDYVFNVGNTKYKPVITPVTSAPSKLSLKVTVGSSTTIQVSSSTESSPSKIPGMSTIDKVTEDNINNALASILSNRTVSTDMTTLTKDFLSSSMVLKKLDKETVKREREDDENNDEQAMEIDEDCTLVRITNENKISGEKDMTNGDKSDVTTVLVEGVDEEDVEGDEVGDGDSEEFVLRVLPADEGSDTDERQTLVMSRAGGAVLRVVSGRQLVYEGGAGALLPVSDDDRSDAGDGGDTHDSNDDSQIELQVSGDEETANAIIAAAREQGGAFIKVESGEMFRVKSVHSKTQGEADTEDGSPLVAYIGNKYKCLVCEKGRDPLSPSKWLSSASAMTQHVRYKHGARVYICTVCAKVVRKQTDYQKHMDEHSTNNSKMASAAEKSKVHECNICKKRYNSRSLLSEHMNVHNGARPHVCTACGKAFASKYTYQAHLKTHLERPRPFKCSTCPKTFFTQQNLHQHEKTHSGVKAFVCKTCGKAFGTQHNLDVHGVVHSKNKPYICGVCGKAFARRAEVKDHMRTHTGERPFACEVCGATFAQRSNLHSHKRATHMDDKRYQCAECPKRFKRRRLLEYHIKALHTGERPLQCEVCRATFVYPEHYKKHARIHSGERPYVCEVCGKSFNSRDNRNTHRFVHSDKKPYECLVCGAGYMRKQLLYTHMNTSGHLAESIVVNQPRVQKVAENVVSQSEVDQMIQITNQTPSMGTVIFEDSEEFDLEETQDKTLVTNGENEPKLYITNDKKLILQDGKSTINLVQDSEDPTLLTLQNMDTNVKSDSDVASLLQGVTMEQLGEQAQLTQMIAGAEGGGVVRLVQVQLNNGTTGWVAISQ